VDFDLPRCPIIKEGITRYRTGKDRPWFSSSPGGVEACLLVSRGKSKKEGRERWDNVDGERKTGKHYLLCTLMAEPGKCERKSVKKNYRLEGKPSHEEGLPFSVDVGVTEHGGEGGLLCRKKECTPRGTANMN